MHKVQVLFLSLFLGIFTLSSDATDADIHQDIEPQITAMHELAAAGDMEAQLNLAVWYWEQQNETPDALQTAIQWFEKAAKKGSNDAQYQMGIIYQQGIGREVDQKLALEWFQKAYNDGDIKAAGQIAFYYYWGVEIEMDKNKALELSDEALQSNDISTQNNTAWFLATIPDDIYCNGAKALSLMQQVISKAPVDAGYFDTLASAYAACDEFAMAEAYQKVAIELCTLQIPEEKDAFEKRLSLYENNERYRLESPFE